MASAHPMDPVLLSKSQALLLKMFDNWLGFEAFSSDSIKTRHETNLWFHKIVSTDGVYLDHARCFSDTSVVSLPFIMEEEHEQHEEGLNSEENGTNEKPLMMKTYHATKFCFFFTNGYNMIHEAVETRQFYPSRDTDLHQLMEFYDARKNIAQTLSTFMKKETAGGDVKVVMANHLLQPLLGDSEVKIDKTIKGKESCPCGCGIRTTYSDTSLGHPSVWHGSIDILMQHTNLEYEIAVMDMDKESESPTGSTLKDDKHILSQLISQAITFSFVQAKRHPNRTVKLVPSIAISMNECRICLYDCENDLLLLSSKLKIWTRIDPPCLNDLTILILWIVLNYPTTLFDYNLHEAAPNLDKVRSGFINSLDEMTKDIYVNRLRYCENYNDLRTPMDSYEAGDCTFKLLNDTEQFGDYLEKVRKYNEEKYRLGQKPSIDDPS